MRMEDPRDLETRILALNYEIAGERMMLAALRFSLTLERCAKFDPSQPRDELGRWTSIGSSPGSAISEAKPESGSNEAVRVAGAFDFGLVDLREDEVFEGPHTIDKHVGKSDEVLRTLVRSKAADPKNAKASNHKWGSFPSVAAANKIVNSVLAQSPETVLAVAGGVQGGATFDAEFTSPVGRIATTYSLQSTVVVSDAYRVLILIRHEPRSPRGFVVHTAFPTE